MQITLTTKVDIPQQTLEDVLTTAVEGGVSYWAGGRNVKRREDLTVWEVTLWDHENRHEEFVVDADRMAKGVRLVHEAIMRGDIHPNSEIGGQFMSLLFTNDAEDFGCVDVVCADAIVQYGCFEELRFA